MPLVLYLPASHYKGDTSPARRLQLWLATQKDGCRRAERFLSDRRHLLELDRRLLDDVGLTREDVLRNVPFRCSGHDMAPDSLVAQADDA